MARHKVCRLDELAVGQLTPAKLGRAKILLTRLPTGEVRAFPSRCPHQGADLEYGSITGFSEGDRPNEISIIKPDEIVRCPWHGFEYCLSTGHSTVVGNAHCKLRLRLLDVELDGEEVVVVL